MGTRNAVGTSNNSIYNSCLSALTSLVPVEPQYFQVPRKKAYINDDNSSWRRITLSRKGRRLLTSSATLDVLFYQYSLFFLYSKFDTQTMKLNHTSFTAERVNSTTFLIIEDDSWGERPRIYALLHPGLHVLVLSDTGCDSPRERNVKIPHLRTFLETIPIPSNNNIPLNPGPKHRDM
ncbi:hypothetical protein BDV97DRAFT_185490 [Delphinella strobiligena]|nr:hypothetical protein BDV97DRAFT_185490 [Delphinella strobiligena]